MAKPGLAQEQTVEEILASIRQVINGDQPRAASAETKLEIAPTLRRPASAAGPSDAGSTVTALRGGRIADAENELPAAFKADADDDTPAASPEADGDGVPMHDVIELAIEEALGGLKSEETRAESAAPAAAEARSPFRVLAKPPRVDARPPAAREMPRSEPQNPAPREVPRLDARPAQPAPPRPVPPSPARSLLSPRANAAVAASFEDLAKVLAGRGARQVDQAVEDLLRPMLKIWLEDNLPSLVERLVREEIERVSRGGR